MDEKCIAMHDMAFLLFSLYYLSLPRLDLRFEVRFYGCKKMCMLHALCYEFDPFKIIIARANCFIIQQQHCYDIDRAPYIDATSLPCHVQQLV